MAKAKDRIVVECTKEFKTKVKLYCTQKQTFMRDFIIELIEREMNIKN